MRQTGRYPWKGTDAAFAKRGTGGNRILPSNATINNVVDVIRNSLIELLGEAHETGGELDLGAFTVDTKRTNVGQISVTVAADLYEKQKAAARHTHKIAPANQGVTPLCVAELGTCTVNWSMVTCPDCLGLRIQPHEANGLPVHMAAREGGGLCSDGVIRRTEDWSQVTCTVCRRSQPKITPDLRDAAQRLRDRIDQLLAHDGM